MEHWQKLNVETTILKVGLKHISKKTRESRKFKAAWWQTAWRRGEGPGRGVSAHWRGHTCTVWPGAGPCRSSERGLFLA